jgi:hypothetical protein
MDCTHETWTAKSIPLSDGRRAMREFCVSCGVSNGGTRLGIAIPLIADADVAFPSYKYVGKTLGQIAEIDKEYIRWVAVESKASERVKKAAARLYHGVQYTPPSDGDIYPKDRIYDPMVGSGLMEKLCQK